MHMKQHCECYPLIMRPSFRHGADTPWAGENINRAFDKSAPSMTGESLEISALVGHESVVVNGELKGKTLSEVASLWGDALTGVPCDVFPLLVKIISAQVPLSVQVHPDDAYSQNKHGKLGKSEAWYVLSAEPGAKIVYGLSVDTAEQLCKSVINGHLEASLTWLDARPGDVFYIPHGTVHALGAGIMIYEIQQSSDVTYRFWDWGRVGTDGQPRTLHIEDALNVSIISRSHSDFRQAIAPGVELRVRDANFELYTIDVVDEMPLPLPGRMRLITTLCALIIDGIKMKPGDSALIPATLGQCIIAGNGRVLMSCTLT